MSERAAGDEGALLSLLMDQVSALTETHINFADLSGATAALPTLRLRPEQTMHHGPFCLMAKQKGGFATCVGQKDKSVAAAKIKKRPLAAVCPHGLWDLAHPVFHRGRLVGIFYGGGFSTQKPLATFPGRAFGGLPIIPHSPEREADLRRRVAFLAEALTLILDRAAREGRWPPKERPSAWMVLALGELLRTRYAEDLTLAAVAESLGVNAHHLGQVIAEKKGEPFRSLLTTARLHAAKGLLPMKLTVREIAARVGYGDPNYFTAIFTKREGLSPRAWRRKYGGVEPEKFGSKNL